MSDQPVELLNQGAGYGVLVGVGSVFAIGMILTTILLRKYLHEDARSTETFQLQIVQLVLFFLLPQSILLGHGPLNLSC